MYHEIEFVKYLDNSKTFESVSRSFYIRNLLASQARSLWWCDESEKESENLFQFRVKFKFTRMCCCSEIGNTTSSLSLFSHIELNTRYLYDNVKTWMLRCKNKTHSIFPWMNLLLLLCYRIVRLLLMSLTDYDGSLQSKKKKKQVTLDSNEKKLWIQDKLV